MAEVHKIIFNTKGTSPPLTFNYNGQLTQVSDASGVNAFGYGHRGNVIAKTQSIGPAPQRSAMLMTLPTGSY